MFGRLERHHWHGGALGAVIGAALAVAVVLLIDRVVTGEPNKDLWLPAGVAMGIVGGGVLGMLFAEIIVGGREDSRATAEARLAVDAEQRRR